MKVRIKKPIIEEATIELSTEQKWRNFIGSVDAQEWLWLRRKLGLLKYNEFLKLLNATNKAESGKLDTK